MIETLDQGYVAPLLHLRPGHKDAPGVFDGGVYRSDRSTCALGMHAKHGFRNVQEPISDSGDVAFVAGMHLYGGLLQNGHFGHFLLESLGRLWAAPTVLGDLASIVFIPRGPGHSIPAFIHDTLRLLGLKASIRLVAELRQFEKLLVPSQLLVPG